MHSPLFLPTPHLPPADNTKAVAQKPFFVSLFHQKKKKKVPSLKVHNLQYSPSPNGVAFHNGYDSNASKFQQLSYPCNIIKTIFSLIGRKTSYQKKTIKTKTHSTQLTS